MTEGGEPDKQDEVVVRTDSQRRRRKRHSHRKHSPGLTAQDRKTIRTLILTAIFALFIVLLWYLLISRPAG